MSAISVASPSSRLDLDAASFARDFGERPFAFGHHLSAHPLLTLPRLVDLCRALPAECIEYNAGNLPISLDGASPSNGLSADDTIRGIESHNSWMVLQNVEQDPAYRGLLLDCIDEIRVHSERRRPGLMQPEAFIFVSSAGAITPYHMDPEHGFLLQIRGTKTVTVFDGSRPDVVTDEMLERFYCGTRHRHLTLDSRAAAHARTFPLAPGDGVHIPVTFPHHVAVGGTYSISLSITFRTPDLQPAGRHVLLERVSPPPRTHADSLRTVVFDRQREIARGWRIETRADGSPAADRSFESQLLLVSPLTSRCIDFTTRAIDFTSHAT